MRVNSLQLKEIRDTLNIADIIGRTVSLKLSGSKLKGRCPFHDEKTPSFFVDPDKGRYYCFGCGEKGDIFDYLMATEGLSFGEAVERAANEAGIELVSLNPEEENKIRQEEAYNKSLFELNEKATLFFQDQLNTVEGRIALDYLNERNINSESVKRYRLGYAPDGWNNFYNHINNSRNHVDLALTLGLLKRKNMGTPYDFYRHRLMFPIMDSKGRVRAFSSRILDPVRNEGKYVNSPESPLFKKQSSIYGLFNAKSYIRKRNQVILVEGNLDVITLAQHGFNETVAPLGTALTENQIRILSKFSKTINLMFDGDSAGQKATMRSIPMLVKQKLSGKVIVLSDKEDPDSLLQNKGEGKLIEMIETSMSHIEHFINRSLAPRNASVSDKIASLKNLSPIWSILSPMEQDMYFEEIALRLNTSTKIVKKYLSGLSGNKSFNQKTSDSIKAISETEADSDVVSLLYIAFLAFEVTSDLIPIDESAIGQSFTSETALDLWRIIRDLPRPVENSMWKQHLDDRFVEKLMDIKKSFNDGNQNFNDEIRQEAFNEVMLNLNKKHIDNQSRMIDFNLSQARKENNKEKINSLLKEKFSLQKHRLELKKF